MRETKEKQAAKEGTGETSTQTYKVKLISTGETNQTIKTGGKTHKGTSITKYVT